MAIRAKSASMIEMKPRSTLLSGAFSLTHLVGSLPLMGYDRRESVDDGKALEFLAGVPPHMSCSSPVLKLPILKLPILKSKVFHALSLLPV
ncbi:hypothetical protein EGJ58_17940 [Brucella anthropi]|nr:hypothetical protein EGJ58_17940 [Brucella anthropi]